MNNRQNKPCILLVDDDPVMEHVVVQALQDKVQVVAVPSCVALIHVLNQCQPQLFILDVCLPWLNGFELCRDLRKNTSYQNVPILFVSALGTEEDREQGLQAGGNRFLAKPFDVADLTRHVEDLLGIVPNEI